MQKGFDAPRSGTSFFQPFIGLAFMVESWYDKKRKEARSMEKNQIPPQNHQSEQITEKTIFFTTGELMTDFAKGREQQVDPLDSAQSLPALFPQEYQPAVPQPSGPVTVVTRPQKKKKRKVWPILRIFGKLILGLVLAIAVLAAGLLGYLTVTEYNPAYAELAQRGANSSKELVKDRRLRIVTFNTGYGALGEDADFFMDGGTDVNPLSKDVVEGNMIGIERILNRVDADLILLQEVDTDSDRSFHMNQWLQYEHDLDSYEYETRFALNYSCRYVPYPLKERIGQVNSGIATYSRFDITSATRYSLPTPFSWPVRTANLKRCFLVTRIPIEDSSQELVVVNLHLEAYDDGEGKIAQTKQLMDFLQAEYEKGNYVIAGGDFNQTFPGCKDDYPVKSDSEWEPGLLESLPQDWHYAYDSSSPTCRLLNQPYDPQSRKTQHFVIDGFILSPNVSLEKVETLNEYFLYSDHNPVAVDIVLN